MPKETLTYAFLKNYKPLEKRVEIYDTEVDGFFVRISPKGRKTFCIAYGSEGKRYTIGTFQNIGLADARSIAKELQLDIAKGKDPQAEKIAKRRAPKPKTVKDLAESFKSKHLPKLRKSTQDDYKRRIDKIIVPALGRLDVNSVSRYEVIELLEEIAEENEAPIQSNRVRAVLSSMYNFGINRGITEHNPVVAVKPLGKENKRKRVYEPDEIRAIWEAMDNQEEPFRSLFKMLLICAQRSGETRLMRWDEINEEIWTIPHDKTKAGREQKLPLPPMSKEILNDLQLISGKSDYVFESPVKRNEPIAWLQKVAGYVRKESKVDDFRLHDLRRTAASYMAESGIDRTVLGKVLNHKGLAGDNQVTAVYDRHEYLHEKLQALTRWNMLLEQILNKEYKVKIYKIS